MGELAENSGFPAVPGAEFGQGGAQGMGAKGPKADAGGAEDPGGEEGKTMQ
jgi:hypothetical protein